MLWSVTLEILGQILTLTLLTFCHIHLTLTSWLYTLPLACPELVDEQGGTHSQVTTLGKPVQGKYK